MCGIAAIFNGESTEMTKLPSLIHDLLIMTQLRGMDSTGIVNLSSKYELNVYKKTVNANDFMEMRQARMLVEQSKASFGTIIHCRKATIGGKTQEAAHPFIVQAEDGTDSLAMVHNGTLTNHTLRDHVSDSHWLSDQIMQKREKALEDLRGAASLIWTNTKTFEHCFYTNGERPLFYGFIKGKNAMIVGSEAELMYAALTRNEVTLEKDTFYKAVPYTLYKSTHKNCTQLETEDIKKPFYQPVGRMNHGGNLGSRGNHLVPYDDDDDILELNRFNDTRPLTYAAAMAMNATAKAVHDIFSDAAARLGKEEPTLPILKAAPTSTPVIVGRASVTGPRFPTSEEKQALFEVTGKYWLSGCKARPSWYNVSDNTAYFSAMEQEKDSDNMLQPEDQIILRNVTESWFNNIEDSFESVVLNIGGVEDDNAAVQVFIASSYPIPNKSVPKAPKEKTLLLAGMH